MSKYTVIARLQLMAGVLTLSDEQSAPRSHALKPLGKNRFEIINPVEFKAGEEIGYEGDLPKALADKMIDADKTESRKKSATRRVGAIHESPELSEPNESPADQY